MEVRSSDRILQKALELFSQKGYDATSVREICQAAGVTKPTLYHFYGSKEGVYRALVEGTLEEYRRTVRDLVSSPGSVAERLRRVTRAHFDYTRERRELVRFVLAISHNPPSSAPVTDFNRYYEDVVGAIAALADEGVASGEFAPGPVDIRMLVFMGAISEALHGFLLAGRPELTSALADALVDTVLQGWALARHGPGECEPAAPTH
jgi:AcrR family transcriptional regulator